LNFNENRLFLKTVMHKEGMDPYVVCTGICVYK